MLTGRATFRGATVTDILVAILEREPDWTALPSTTPPAITRLLRRCLEKDPKQRLRDIGDARIELASSVDVDDVPARARPSFRWSTKPLLAAAALTAVVISASVALTVWLRPAPSHAAAPTGTIRLSVPPPPGTSFAGDVERVFLALSPDGSQLAFVATEPSGPSRIWLRPVSAIDARPLAGTEGATSLFWSPDGGSIAFFAGSKLKRLDLPAGAAVSLCDVPEGIGLTGTWGTNGEILFASVEGNAIFSVPSAGGTPAASSSPIRSKADGDQLPGVSARWQALPVSDAHSQW